MGFMPICVEDYIKQHVKRNPDDRPDAVRKLLRECIGDALAGARCRCGELIWVVGSAFVGHGCFTCITGEADTSADYEIDVVLEDRRAALVSKGVQGSG